MNPFKNKILSSLKLNYVRLFLFFSIVKQKFGVGISTTQAVSHHMLKDHEWGPCSIILNNLD